MANAGTTRPLRLVDAAAAGSLLGALIVLIMQGFIAGTPGPNRFGRADGLILRHAQGRYGPALRGRALPG